jgi:uncharacterized protein YoxC
MANWQLTLIILASILVGALIPLLVSVVFTLQAVRRQLESTGQRLDATLDQAQETLARVNRLSRGLDGGERQLEGLKNMVGDLTETLGKVNGLVKMGLAVGAAVGPALAALMTRFTSRGAAPAAPAEPAVADAPEVGAAAADAPSPTPEP